MMLFSKKKKFVAPEWILPAHSYTYAYTFAFCLAICSQRLARSSTLSSFLLTNFFFPSYPSFLQVALLKFTGYKIINNISDTGKAFLIILITDIFLG